jgi:hypothetical protein
LSQEKPAVDIAKNLREAARAYLYAAIESYLAIEARVSVRDYSRFATSANVVCSLNRAIEHFLKLRLCKVDSALLYPLPKNIREYCYRRGIDLHDDETAIGKRARREALSHTVSFKEALCIVEATLPTGLSFDFQQFRHVKTLRDSLEHHWDRNEEFLQKVMGSMSTKVIPLLQRFISVVLGENPSDFFDQDQLTEVQKLDRAIKEGHSLELQCRFEEHRELFATDPNACCKKWHYPEKYSGLAEVETEAECPVCGKPFMALWDWEAEYGIDNGEGYISGGFPDA